MGVVFYIMFLLIGFLYVHMSCEDRNIYMQIWLGGLIGTLALMFGIVPVALVFGFTIPAHLVLFVIFCLPPFYLFWHKEKKKLLQTVRGGWRLTGKSGGMTHLIFLLVILPVSVLIWVLLTNHVMAPYEGGGIASGQSTYGDLAMHMGIITSVADHGVFPPAHNLIAGLRLNYPFLVDTLSSSLYLLGGGLRTAILLPSYVMSLLLVMGFYFLAHRLTERKAAAVLATILFFIGGGFGFAYFFEGAKADPTKFTMIFNDYYHTPTNYNEMNIRWANPICDMIVPQRTTMAGWTYLVFALWTLLKTMEGRKRRTFIWMGILAGCMPMIHTHSFMALGILSAGLLIYDLIFADDKKECFINWCIYGGIAAVLALPQLFFWTFGQAGEEGFVKFHFNWVNTMDPYLWFWVKNWGIAFLVAIPAFLYASKRNKAVLIGGAMIFAVAEFILFQPNPYDNNKLFFVTYMLILCIGSGYLVHLYEKLKGVRGRAFLAALLIAAGTISGVLTIGREQKSGAMYRTFSEEELEYAAFVKENTDKDAVFAAYYGHLSPTAVLAGRQMFYGGDLWMGSHGYGMLAQERKEILSDLYSASDTEEAKQIAEENGISYLVDSRSERENFDVNDEIFDGMTKIYDADGYRLFEIR